MSIQPDRVLVQGLYNADGSHSASIRAILGQRRRAFTEHAELLGITACESADGGGRALANRLLRRLRGTARPVDAVEIIALNESALCASLERAAGRDGWRQIAGCEGGGFDRDLSFILMGTPIRWLESEAGGQRLFWFGNGLAHLSRAEFAEHYTTRHGPLVAGYARAIGLRSYLQVPAQESALCNTLRGLGLGQASPPAVFARLVMGAPPFSLAGLREQRAASVAIKADEGRHIDFPRSTLLLASP